METKITLDEKLEHFFSRELDAIAFKIHTLKEEYKLLQKMYKKAKDDADKNPKHQRNDVLQKDKIVKP